MREKDRGNRQKTEIWLEEEYTGEKSIHCDEEWNREKKKTAANPGRGEGKQRAWLYRRRLTDATKHCQKRLRKMKRRRELGDYRLTGSHG